MPHFNKLAPSGKNSNKLQKFDIYGKKVELSLNGSEEAINTNFGGLMSILFFALAMLYVFQQLATLVTLGDPEFTVSDQVINVNAKDLEEKTENDFGEIMMKDYEDNFNLFIGTTNRQIDLLDNPYISFKIYNLDQNFVPYLSEDIQFKKCTKADQLKFIKEYSTGYYPNALCFEDDKSKFKMYSNWYNADYLNTMIVLEKCNNLTYNGVCKPSEDIDIFLATNIFYMVRQKNVVDKSIYNDSKDYFPIKIQSDSIFYKSIGDINPNYVNIVEIKLGIDTVEYSDSYFNYFEKTHKKNFLNFKATREIQDVRSYYAADGNFPVQIWQFGLYDPGIKYERHQYQLLDFLGDIGGYTDALLIIFTMIVHTFCDINITIKKIQTFKFLIEKEEIDPLFKTVFQLKLFFYEKICCRNRGAKKIMYLDHRFKDSCDLYDATNEVITQKLSMTKLLKLNLKFKDEYIQNKMKRNMDLLKNGILKNPLLSGIKAKANEIREKENVVNFGNLLKPKENAINLGNLIKAKENVVNLEQLNNTDPELRSLERGDTFNSKHLMATIWEEQKVDVKKNKWDSIEMLVQPSPTPKVAKKWDSVEMRSPAPSEFVSDSVRSLTQLEKEYEDLVKQRVVMIKNLRGQSVSEMKTPKSQRKDLSYDAGFQMSEKNYPNTRRRDHRY